MSSKGLRTQMTVRAKVFATAAIVVSIGAVLVGAVPSGASLNPRANLPGKNLWAHAGAKPAGSSARCRAGHSREQDECVHARQERPPRAAESAGNAHSFSSRLPTEPFGQVPALRAEDLEHHGAGPRGAAPGHLDLQRARDRRPGRDDPRRPEPHRLPRVGALVAAGRGTSIRSTTSTRASTRATTAATSRATSRARSSSVTPTGGEISVDRGYYHADDTVTVSGSDFAGRSDDHPHDLGSGRALRGSHRDRRRGRDRRVRDELRRRSRTATSRRTSSPRPTATSRRRRAIRSYASDDPTTDPPTGDVLRFYRLALITDPGYANYFGGAANVTAAKVALINRVDQVYEEDLSIRMQLIANNDLLNLNTWDAATAPNGPCGAAACFTQSQVTGCSRRRARAS